MLDISFPRWIPFSKHICQMKSVMIHRIKLMERSHQTYHHYTPMYHIIYLPYHLVNSKLMIKYQITKEQITRQDGYTFISNPVGLFSCLFFVMFLFWCFVNVYNNAKIILVLEKHAIEKHIWNEIFAQEYNKGGEFICPNETCKKGIIVFMNAYLVQIGS